VPGTRASWEAPMARIVRQNDITIVELDERYDALDEGCIEELSDLLLAQVEQIQPPWMILDFARTVYISSRVLEVLFRGWKRINDREGRLVMCNLGEFCAEVIHITRLDTVWDIQPTRDAAIERILSWGTAETPQS
jgi:anti-anti-sigma factor